MKRIYPLSGLVLLGSFLCVGCNGGNDSCCTPTSKSIARQRAIETMRITRAILAVSGFALRETRGASGPVGNRAAIWLSAILGRRSASSSSGTPTLDPDTGLYYTITVNSDGSGEQDLFVDPTAEKSAGAFTWKAPTWDGNQPGDYPATIQTVFQITAGTFAGEHGTITVVADDATGDNGTLAINLTDSQKENCVSNFTIVNGVLKATCQCTSPGNGTFNAVFSEVADVISCVTTYVGGGTADIVINPDGSATQTVDNSSGQTEATGSTNPSGDDTINYDDGSSETVNVDTGDDTGDSSDSAVKRPVNRVSPVTPVLTPRKGK